MLINHERILRMTEGRISRTNVTIKEKGGLWPPVAMLVGFLSFLLCLGIAFKMGADLQRNMITLNEQEVAQIKADNLELGEKARELEGDNASLVALYEQEVLDKAIKIDEMVDKDKRIEDMEVLLAKQSGETDVQYRDRMVEICSKQAEYSDEFQQRFEETRQRIEQNRIDRRDRSESVSDFIGRLSDRLF